MKIGRFVQAALMIGVAFLMVSSASANIIYSTNGAGTKFITAAGGTISNGGLTLTNNVGAPATLTFVPNVNSSSGVPSNINYGNFLLTCPNCGTQAQGGAAVFGLFTFDLQVTDTSDNSTGLYHGTSSGTQVFSDVSTININWTPLQLGPGTNNASGGTNFGSTVFTITSPTGIVAPNSGTPPGQTTVQGTVNTTAIPEPATLSLIGGALFGLGLLSRKRKSRQ